jgi:hypothetical protein
MSRRRPIREIRPCRRMGLWCLSTTNDGAVAWNNRAGREEVLVPLVADRAQAIIQAREAGLG